MESGAESVSDVPNKQVLRRHSDCWGFPPDEVIHSRPSRHDSAFGRTLFPDSGGASSPQFPTPLSDTLPQFDELAADLKRLVSIWCTKTRANLAGAQDDLNLKYRRLEEERTTLLQDVEAQKAREMKRMKDIRQRMESEMAALAKQLSAEREAGRNRLDVERARIESDRQRMTLSLKKEQEKLALDREALETERSRIVDANMAAENVVEINVGGTVFETARSVLVQFNDSYLAALFTGRNELTRDRNGRVFVDRDPTFFRAVLNFLRDPETPPWPRDTAESVLLCQEGAYYGIKFMKDPMIVIVGGHDGTQYLNSMEALDVEAKSWRSLPCMETARAFTTAGSILNQVLVAGGQNLDYKALCDMEIFDVLRGEWMSGPPLNNPRRNAAAATLDLRRWYVVGGFDGSNVLSSVEFYDSRSKNWVTGSPLLKPRTSGVLVSLNEHTLAVWGGSSTERLRDGEIYDARANKWRPACTTMMEERSGCGGAVCDGRTIFVCGGVDSLQKTLDSVEVCDVGTESVWRYGKPMPTPVVDASILTISDSLMVTGGQGQGDVFDHVLVYDPESEIWNTGPVLQTARFGHASAVISI